MLYRLTWSVLICNMHGYLQGVLEVLMFKIFFWSFLVDPSRFFVIASCLFASSCKSVKYWWILTIIHVLGICVSFAIHLAVYTNTSLSRLEQTCRKSVYGMFFLNSPLENRVTFDAQKQRKRLSKHGLLYYNIEIPKSCTRYRVHITKDKSQYPSTIHKDTKTK
jgi:hypothetical protein